MPRGTSSEWYHWGMGSAELMRRLEAEATGCSAWSNGAGDRYAAHSHAYDKVLYCVEGSITFHLEEEGRSIVLAPGDRMVLPAGTQHSAVVGPGGCACIEGRRPGGRGPDGGGGSRSRA